MWCPQSLAATRASAALLFDTIQHVRVDVRWRQSVNQISQLTTRIGGTVGVTQNDFRERIARSPVRGGKQLVGGSVYRNSSAHARTLHESLPPVNAGGTLHLAP